MRTDVSDGFVEDWLGDDAEALREAVAEGRNIAIISEPLGGRGRILEYVLNGAKGAKVKRQQFEPFHRGNELIETDGRTVAVYEDVHHLYTRCIRGYSRLDDFLDEVATADGPVVTSWNVFSWRYVSQVRGADSVFSVVVEPTSLDTSLLDRLLPEEELPISEEETREDGSSFVMRDVQLPSSIPLLGGRAVTVPRRVDYDEMSPREVAIERVRSESDGNPGVAERMWEEIVARKDEAESAEEETENGIEKIDSLLGTEVIEFEPPTSFALRTVISKGSVTKEELRETAGVEDVDRTVRSLRDRGLVSVISSSETDHELVKPEPTRIPDTVNALRERSTLW